jgi:hypothetical protein
MRIGRGNGSTRRVPAPVPLCPPQIPHDLTRARTLAAEVESRRRIAWVMTRPGALLITGTYRQDLNGSGVYDWTFTDRRIKLN